MKLQLPQIPELDYQIVMDAMKGYAFPRKSLADAISRGNLQRVKKGLYVQKGSGISLYSREILANMIYGPSYVSLEYALSYYGLIPERVEEVTSVTTGRKKLFDTPLGRFSYLHVSIECYSFGFSRKKVDGERFFLMAGPEKAIIDRVMRERGRFSISSMKNFLFDNLRIDPAEFIKLDGGIFAEAAKLTGRHSMNVVHMLKEKFS
jgi:predicted transcriptional regulator of viral defense system